MPNQNGVAHWIMEIILRSQDCLLEEVVLQCPDLTWNQVFLTVDHLSRSGEVRPMPKGPSVYTLRLSNQASAVLAPGDDVEGREAR
ncbi:MAG TPA: hypothetical protein VNK46_01700 [Nitrospiraceae bacterium]|jgi:hypothetical protein|nr:hypothetical protein [Nitrospiraceae bacterium]